MMSMTRQTFSLPFFYYLPYTTVSTSPCSAWEWLQSILMLRSPQNREASGVTAALILSRTTL
eukprot:1394356-Amorphochlora_amoeboformis.AAC.3